MHDSQAKFQHLLRELFQFDSADLDFGIYRIMNHKREVIEHFISVELPEAIAAELDQGALAEQTQLQHELAEMTRQIKQTLGDGALDADGALAEAYHAIPLGKQYLELRAKAAGARNQDAQEAAVYNHLYTFFSRYYQEGDFISKRRYAKQERYAIPYNGEEVMLYWANHDQYYVKSGEYFTDYRYQAPNGVSVHFKLQGADVEQNNVKGDKRCFLPQADAIAWDAARGELMIPCVYRPLTQQEATRYGKSNQQEAIIDQAVAAILAQVGQEARALAALTATRRSDARGNPVSYLEHHLRQYTRRNTSDFFIHKELAGFLRRELDFYLKHEVLNLAELTAAGEELAAGWFQLLRLITRVGGRIIDFLAQIEAFQKMLWEKRKFVTESFYCVRVGVIAEDFHADIAANDAQWQTWKSLYDLDDPKTPAQRTMLLETHPSLMLDTRCFAPDTVDRLLASFADLDGGTDGLLVHSENWQALNLLGERYREQVRCVYIDPPYNTGDSEILYKNEYLSSSWLALMENRLALTMRLLAADPVLYVAIDDFEMVDLCELIDRHFSVLRREMIVVNHHPQGGKAKTLANTHEYMLCCVDRESDLTLAGRTSNNGVEHRPFKRSGTAESNFRYGRPNSFYAILVDPGTKRVADIEPPPGRDDKDYATDNTHEGYLRIYPLGSEGEERVWRRSYESCKLLVEANKLLCTDNLTVYQLIDAHERTPALFSNWVDPRYNAGTYGANLLGDIIGEHNPFAYPKSIHTVGDAIFAADIGDDNQCIDFFAGSGTTGHAVINLNREDGGRRRFILVEMGDYFDTVLLPRLLKVSYTPEWKEGKPKRTATAEEVARSPRLIKVLRLESYEDALNNIDFDDGAGQPALRFDDYLLQYMLRWETRHSATLLTVAKLDSPFAYTLRLHRDGATHTQPVDLPETFAYLLGLTVRTRKTYDDNGRRYLLHRGALRDGRTVAVLWRDTAGWTEADYRRDREFVAAHKLAEGVDDFFVNGDSLIAGAQALEGVFKARMFAPVEA
jgi:adenine-specific DNA-methyltransferase